MPVLNYQILCYTYLPLRSNNGIMGFNFIYLKQSIIKEIGCFAFFIPRGARITLSSDNILQFMTQTLENSQ